MISILLRAAHAPRRQAASDEHRRRRFWIGLADRLARASLWALLVVLVVREGAEDVRTLRLRVWRVAGARWADMERRSRRDVRRSQIGLVASRIGTRTDRERRSG